MRNAVLVSIIVMLAAPAAAQPGLGQGQGGVFISGDARMGVAYDSSAEGGLSFVNRLRIKFHFQGQTDGGLGYGVALGDRDSAGPATARGDSDGALSFGSALSPEQRRPQPLRWSGE